MEFADVIKNRYSCKKYSDKQISEEQLTAILEAGRVAPTARNTQEQHVYVVQSPEMLAVIDEATPCRYGAPTVLVVAYDTTQVYTYPDGQHTSGVEDATIVATHMMLAAENTGVDSCWINHFKHEVIMSGLPIAENYDVVMLLDLGFAAEGSSPLQNHFSRKELAETVTYL